MRITKRSSGVTLIELLTVLAILAILLGIGVPGFQSFIQSQRLTTVTNELFASINLARSEAIQRGTRVDLVPTGDGPKWANGWLVFIDQNNNQKPDAGEQIIYSHGPAPKGVSISSNFTDNTPQYVAYTGTGRTRSNNNGLFAGSFSVAQSNGDNQTQRKVKINVLGRARVCNPNADADC